MATKKAVRSAFKAGFAAAPVQPLPAKLAPQLATLAMSIPTAGQWSHEVKFDGYRLMTRIASEPKMITRGGHNWSDTMPGLVADLKKSKIADTWLDGEIVVLNDKGVPDFNALQNAFDRHRSAGILYFVFDLPFFDGHDLRRVPLAQRRELLQAVLVETDRVKFSADFAGEPADILQSACAMGLEGIMAKRVDAPYASSRSTTWLKLKCKRRQEFVIIGWVDREDGGRSKEVGSLLLAVYGDARALVFAGHVGTGWDSAAATALREKLVKIEVDQSPIPGKLAKGRWSRRAPGSERWAKPTLVAEVNYGEWTPGGQLRHPVYVALRTDKKARDVRREAGGA